MTQSAKSNTTGTSARTPIDDVVEPMSAFADAANWYVNCLRDVVAGKPVMGLAEAKAAYAHWYGKVRAIEIDWQER